MGQQLKPYLESARRLWASLSPGRRIGLLVTFGLGVALVLAIVNWVQNPDYAILYRGLAESDAAAVTTKLKELGVPYRLEDGGGTILVPAAQVPDVRLQLAAAGLPQNGGWGLELFGQPGLIVTDFAQRVNYQRALEGELARTIGRLEGVESARVHLVLPRSSPLALAGDQKPPAPTASVVLRLRSGARLGDEQVRAITYLVSGAVEGLKPENVTIVDGSGRVLWSGVEGGAPGAPGSRVFDAQRRVVEQELTQKAQSVLDRLVGAGNSVVQVSALLDTDQYQAQIETLNPRSQPGALRTSRQITETFRGTGTVPGGVPGTESNIPTYPAVTGGQGQSEYQRQEVQNSFDASRSVEHIVRTPGSIRRLSVGVVVDSNAAAPAQLDNIRQVVAAALGIDPQRGDVLTVQAMSLQPTAEGAGGPPAQGAEGLPPELQRALAVARVAALVVAPLALILLVFLLMRRTRTYYAVPAGLAAPAPAVAPPEPEAIPAGAAPETPVPLAPGYAEQLSGIARQRPEVIAQVIQGWLNEESNR
jgi:flagellar M-ring protein FliF